MRIIAPLFVVASGLITLVCTTSMSRVDKSSGDGLAPNVETTAQGETAGTEPNLGFRQASDMEMEKPQTARGTPRKANADGDNTVFRGQWQPTVQSAAQSDVVPGVQESSPGQMSELEMEEIYGGESPEWQNEERMAARLKVLAKARSARAREQPRGPTGQFIKAPGATTATTPESPGQVGHGSGLESAPHPQAEGSAGARVIDLAALQEQMAEMSAALATLAGKTNALEAKNAQLEAQNARLETQNEELKNTVSALEEKEPEPASQVELIAEAVSSGVQAAMQHLSIPPAPPAPLPNPPDGSLGDGGDDKPVSVKVEKLYCDKLVYEGKPNPQALAEWMTQVVTAAGAASDHGPGVVQLAKDSGHGAYLRLLNADEDSISTIQAEQPEYKTAQLSVHNKIVGYFVQRAPTDAQKYVQNQATHRSSLDGQLHNFQLHDLFYKLERMFGPMTNEGRLKIVREVEEKKDVKSNDLLQFLRSKRTTMDKLEASGLINTGQYDYSQVRASVEHAMNSASKAVKDRLVIWNITKPIPVFGVDKQFFDEYLKKVTAWTELHMESKPTCDYCNNTGHTSSDCRKKAADEKKAAELKEANRARTQAEQAAAAARRAAHATGDAKAAGGKAGKGGGGKPVATSAPAEPKTSPNRPGNASLVDPKSSPTRPKPTFPCKYLVRGEDCPHGTTCAFSHDAQLVELYKNKECPHGKLCPYVGQKSGCGYGLHNLPGRAAKNTELESGDGGSVCGAAFDTACTHGVTGDPRMILEERAPVGVQVTGSAVLGTDATLMNPTGECEGTYIPGAKDLISAFQACEEKRYTFVWVGEDSPVPTEIPKGCSIHYRDEDGSTQYVKVPVINRKPMVSMKLPASFPSNGSSERVADSCERGAYRTELIDIEDRLPALELDTETDSEYCWSDSEDDREACETSWLEPCAKCGEVDHWTQECVVATPVQTGVTRYEMLPQRTRRIIQKRLAKCKDYRKPSGYWTSTSINPTVPVLPHGAQVQVYDFLLDADFNVLMSERTTADKQLTFDGGHAIRLFFDPDPTSSRKFQFGQKSEPAVRDADEKGENISGVMHEAHELARFACDTVLENKKEDGGINIENVAQRLSKLADDIMPDSWSGYKSAEREDRESLMKFVDDGMLGTLPERTELVWNELGEDFEREGHKVVGKEPVAYAGIKVRVYDVPGSKYKKITSYDQTEFCTSITNEFFQEAQVKPKKRDTPGPVTPIAYGNQENQSSEVAEKVAAPGRFKNRCRHYLGALGYLSRGSRPDITFFVNFLLRYVDKWTVDLDKKLLWLFCYLHFNATYVLCNLIDVRDTLSFSVKVLPDASHADADDRRSTSGFFLFGIGEYGSLSTIEWGSGLLTTVTLSTQESEGGGLLRATRAAIPITSLSEVMLGRDLVGMEAESDNRALITNLDKGGIGKVLATARRTHGISQAFLADFWSREGNSKKWRSGKFFPPDATTKSLPFHMFGPIRSLMNLVRLDDLDAINDTKPQPVESSAGPVAAHETEKEPKPKQLSQRQLKVQQKNRLAKERKETWQKNQTRFGKVLKTVMHEFEKYSEADWKHALHVCSGHKYAADCICSVCSELKVKRQPHSHEGVSETAEAVMHGDVCGAFKPTGVGHHRYCHCFRMAGGEAKGFRINTPVPSKHTKWSVHAYKKAQRILGEKQAEKFFSDGGSEYRGEFEDYLLLNKIGITTAPRYSPWAHGFAESNVSDNFDMSLACAETADAPDDLWPLLMEYSADCENLFSGACEPVYGMNPLEREPPIWAAFGTLCTLVKEVPEKTTQEDGKVKKLEPKTVRCFFIGISENGRMPKVALYKGGKIHKVESQNVKIHHGVGYFKPGTRDASKLFQPPEMARILFETKKRAAFDTAQHEVEYADGWLQCCECGKFRYLRADEVALLDGPCLQEFCCIDVCLSCNDAADDVTRLIRPNDGAPQRVMVFSELPHESHQTKVISLRYIDERRQEKFNEKYGTWGDALKAGIDKEYGKYARFQVYDSESVEMQWVKANVPDCQFVRVGLVYYIKFFELGRENWVLGVRLVVYGNKQWDANGELASGVYEGEVLWTATPALASIRLFVDLQTMMQHEVSIDDYVAAYLHAVLKGPPVYFLLPRVLLNDAGLSMKAPVNRAYRAAYGQKRAGHDYSAHARAVEDSKGWTNCRVFDVDPSITVRKVDGGRVTADYVFPRDPVVENAAG